MKNAIKVISVALAAVVFFAFLASCSSSLSGVYSSDEGGLGDLIDGKLSYNFKKSSNVTITVTTTLLGQQSSKEYDGKYEIIKADDGTESIKLTFEDSDAKLYSGTFSFEQDKDAGTVTISGITYTKS